jgi:HD-GYP domain-containing protein (c-di-GMP phosphodiesterase class II)
VSETDSSQPYLPGELLRVFAAAEDERRIGHDLAWHLHDRFGAAAVSVWEAGARGRRRVLTGAGRRPPATPAGATGFSYTGSCEPHWLVLCERGLPPSQRELAHLRAATDTACLAAVGAVRLRAERRRAESGRVLAELGETLALEHGEERVLRVLTRAVSRLVENRGVATWRNDGGSFRLVAACGYPPRVQPPLGAPAPAEAHLDDVVDSRRLRVGAAREHPGLVIRCARAALVPIGEREANRGVLVVERDGAPDPAEERLLYGVADQALLALEKERLLAAQERSLEGVVECLGHALALRHRETGEHSDRLIADCVSVARALGIRGAALRDLRFAAALHDLGKIGIPERILLNRGPLDEEGWRLIRAHPELGASIMDAVDALHGAAALVRACHEHWDGGGYPAGLAGEEIPLGARIIFASDAYHAMCEDRPYQAALSPAQARARLRELAGVDFDPRVVDALLAHLERRSEAGAAAAAGVAAGARA